MDQIHDSVAWYQKKIGLHDKQLWEQSVDRKVLRGIRNAPRRSVRAKTEFIDVDLIRGSTFTRAKPQVSWTYISTNKESITYCKLPKVILFVLFFPFHYKWWLQQTSKRFFAFLLILYTLQLLTTVVFCQNVGAKLAQDELTLCEVFFPIVLMLLLGYIHSTTVVSQSHVSHRSQRDIKSIREYQIRRKRNLSSSSPNHSCEKPLRNSSTLLQDVDRKSPPSVDRRPKRVVKNKEFVVKPKKNGGIESKSVSWSDAYQEEAFRIVPNDRIKKQESQDSEITTDEENNGSLKRAESFDSEIEKNINDSKKEITSDNLENLNLSLSGKPEENSGNCKIDADKKEKCQLNLKLSPGGFPHQENGATQHKHNNCHSNTGVDLLTSDIHLAEKCENNIIEGLKIPNFTDGTILKVENLTAEEAEEYMNPSIDSLSSITSSSSAPESNTLEYEGTSDLDNLAVGGSGIVDYKQTDKVQAKDNKPGSSFYRNPREQLNIIRHGENLSEDSGIDFTNKTLLFRSESVPLPSLHSKPKKEVMSDTDQERNNSGSESDKETQLKAKTALLQGLRRRSHTVGDESSESGPFYRTKRIIARNKESLKKDLSSSDGETSQASHASGHKLTSSDWEDRVQSDDTTSTYSSSCGSDVEIGNEAGQETSTTVLNSSSANQTAGENNIHVINLLQPELTLCEVFFPIVLMLLLGYIHSTTVVSQSHVSHRSQRDIKSIREYQIRRKRNLSSSSPNHSCEKPSRNSSTLLQDVDRKSPPSIDRRPKRVVKNKEFVVKPKKNGGIESKSVSWSDAYQEEAFRIVPDDRIKKQESQDSEITTDEENNGSLKRAESFDSEIEKNINDSKKEITSDNLENLNLSLSGKPEENSGNCKIEADKKEKCQLKLKLSPGGFPHQENGLKIPNFTDGTILKVENLTAEEAEEFMNPSIDSLSSITSSSSAPESNTLEYEGTSDLDNLAVGGSGIVDYKQTDKVQAKDNKPGSSFYRNPREQLNIIRHGENLSEDSGIDFTNKTLLFRSESVPLPLLHSKPKKEVMSDTDQERNNSGSESDKETQLKAKTALLQGLRRPLFHTVGDESSESGPFYRTKRIIARNKESLKKDLSSSDGETSQTSHASGHKLTSSDWEDRVQSDDTTSTYSSSCGSDVEIGNEAGQETSTTVLNSSSANQTAGENNIHVINLLQPPTSSSTVGHHYVPPDKVSCVIWEKGECQKVDLTALELGWTIIEKVDDIPESSDYILIGFTFSVLLCLVPLVFRLYHVKEFPSLMSLEIISFLSKVWCCLMHNSWRLNLIMMNGIIQRFWLSSVFFFLLSVADRTFKQRLLYAKHFCYLTSSRRAKKFDMPHFRLNKVRNIKTWLSIRSYLKKRGPQRSVDVIVSASFLITIVLITLMCLQLLKDADTYLDFLCNWELLFWSMTLGVYLFRFLTLGLKINKKYRNLSVLITEQINLYLQMEQKPHKKEELMVANNVLKLAEDLLKELESPFKVSGLQQTQKHGLFHSELSKHDTFHSELRKDDTFHSERRKDGSKKEENSKDAHLRYRRQALMATTSPANLTIEVLFVVDYAVYQRFLDFSNGSATDAENNIEIYYARIFDGLNRRYKGIESSELRFILKYSDLDVSKKPETSVWTTQIKQSPEVGSPREMVDTALALDRFLNWIVSTQDLPNFDYAILFSGYNLTYGGSASNTGLSYPSSICQNISLMATTMGGPVAIVEESFSDIKSIGIAAQELGRSLGARKDFDGNNCFPFELNIMTSKFTFPSKSKAPNLWKFSTCSIEYFEKYITDLLNITTENCLLTSEPSAYIANVPEFLRQRSADIVNIDDQCRTVYGPESFLCRALQGSDFGSVCYGAYCYVPQSQICSLILPGDGTLCSNKSICFEGRCSFAERANETLEDCPFGDQPFIPPNNDICKERISIRGFDCYQPQLRITCCQSCADQYTGIGGCEYGDRWSLCNASLCATYDNYTRDVRCCRKCSIKPYSKSSILTSTATEPTTEMEITSVTFGTPDSEMLTDKITTEILRISDSSIITDNIRTTFATSEQTFGSETPSFVSTDVQSVPYKTMSSIQEYSTGTELASKMSSTQRYSTGTEFDSTISSIQKYSTGTEYPSTMSSTKKYSTSTVDLSASDVMSSPTSHFTEITILSSTDLRKDTSRFL
ncbi:Putative homeodomain transcription factor 1,Putative homeodomain transcription factor,Putative homeodomain transcription factor 2 [Mytilus coruscus]|uniref:Homeodomain transcription factor 1,Putative homeodomain transcription factor,Putative homeodomain transcription factor 2 n=1 Tax=Mytilus coruscus TaxID=42192 RepID=A0A6J8BKA4_MYTCO|nr:unnamed protein product [Mytilus coruscus]CAC5383821.1 Putative homeodomain transcription factor 1,Putative homeodomain transcription factor,Putative homeodomain transcription factor 2 [Mytilus coruscus]